MSPVSFSLVTPANNELSSSPPIIHGLVAAVDSDSSNPGVYSTTEDERRCVQVLLEFPVVFGEPFYNVRPSHGYALDIEMFDDSPLTSRPRRCSVIERGVISGNYIRLTEKGAVVRKSSNFASPITVVRKKDGTHRVCVDYTRLNSRTKDLNYPLPLISSLYTLINKNHRFFTCLDLKDAFLSLPLTPRASERAGIITLDGVFLPLRTPFGLKNAPAKFCEMVAAVIQGLESFVFAYLDDFLIFSETIEDHLIHLRKLLTRFRKFGLFVNKKKCVFAKDTVKFLGHEVSVNGIRPLQEKISLVKQLTPPTTLRDLRSFLGVVGYLRDHIKDLSLIAQPLYDLLKGQGNKPARRLRSWGPTEKESYESVVRAVQSAETLSYEDPSAPLVLTTDASLSHAGAVLEQNLDQAMRPLAYFSKSFPHSVKCRSTFNRELTAIHMALKHFKHRVRGRQLTIRTDHKAIIQAVSNGVGEHSPSEQRMIFYIKEFTDKVTYIKGEDNVLADVLSRPYSLDKEGVHGGADVCAVSYDIPEANLCSELIATIQEEDPSFLEEELPGILEVSSKALDNGQRLFGVVDRENEVDTFRPWIPPSLRPLVFHTLHDIIHQGQQKSVETVSTFYFWPSLTKDIQIWTKCCPRCQTSKVTRHNRQRLQSYPSDLPRLQVLHIDLMGPLQESNSCRYCLTMRDRGTGFLVVTAIERKTSALVVDGIKNSFIAIFGVPSTIITDNGGEFNSWEFDDFCSGLGIKHKKVTAYHPQSNGFIERVHRSIKVSLRALDDPSEWASHLPLIQLFYNNQVSDSNTFTPYQLVFGQAANLPGTLFNILPEGGPHPMLASVSDAMIFFENMTHHHRSSRDLPSREACLEKTLFEVNRVLVRVDNVVSPLHPRYRGPFQVITRHNKYFSIQCEDGLKNISVDRLKAFHELPSARGDDDELEEDPSSNESSSCSDDE